MSTFYSEIIEKILYTCGFGRVLNINCHDSVLVQELLLRGIDSFGVGDNDLIVEKSNCYVPQHFQVADFMNLPFEDNSFDTVVMLNSLNKYSLDKIDKILTEIYRVTKRNVFLRVRVAKYETEDGRNVTTDRTWWEKSLFSKGFRKHPAYYVLHDYETLEKEASEEILIVIEKIPKKAIDKYPLEYLMEERNLHMDMTRETGCRSDGHIIRYQVASEFIRLGDVVLDAACGLGYGSYLLAQMSEAKVVLGYDLSEYAINYALENFQSLDPRVSFKKQDVQNLHLLDDNSVDFIASFETLEHIPNPEEFLEEAFRVLRPGGRIIVSVPNKWLDENGKDPSPYHIHTYSWEKLYNQINNFFLAEKAWALTMNSYWESGKNICYFRQLREFSIHENGPEIAECIIVLAMKDPLLGLNVPYNEGSWGKYDSTHNLVAFERDYLNPFLWKGIQQFFPHSDLTTRQSLIDKVLEDYPGNTPDYGGALCYWCYRLLEKHDLEADALNDIFSKIEEYMENENNKAHVFRWKISLLYVKSQLLLKIGDMEGAKRNLLYCTQFDALQYSPTIGTKIINAYYQLGLIANSEGNNRQEYWESALKEIKRYFDNCNWTDIYGDVKYPIPWGLKEMADVLDIGVTCAWGILFPDRTALLSRLLSFRSNQGYTKHLQGHLKWLKDENLKWEKECEKLEKENSEMQQSIINLKRDYEKLCVETNMYRIRYETISNAFFWRITKPIRVVIDKIRKEVIAWRR